MVERTAQLDSIFHSLSDPIRRDILERVIECERSISELVEKYEVSFTAISKHIKVLEKANLVHKRKEGKKYMVGIAPEALIEADKYLEQYRLTWQQRHEKLETLLKEK